MNVTHMAADLRQTLRVVLPHGSPLDEEIWERRHRGIVLLLWVHAAGTAVFGVVRGVAAWHSAAEGAILAVCGLAAARGRHRRHQARAGGHAGRRDRLDRPGELGLP